MKSKEFAEDLEGHTKDLKEEYKKYEDMAEEDLSD
jgi:hypothetical protein